VNFLFWKAQALPGLWVAKVMALPEGTDLPPSEHLEVEDDEEKKQTIPNPAYDTWVTRDQHVMSYLMNSLSDELLAHVIGLEHAS
jgi:hypothetical protein